MSAALGSVDAIAGPDADDVVVDMYLSWPDAPTDGDELSAALHDALPRIPSVAVAAGDLDRHRP